MPGPRPTPSQLFPHDKRLIRIRDVISKVGLSKMTIYQRQKEGSFPQSVPVGANAVAWIASEVDDWIAERIAERDAKRRARGKPETRQIDPASVGAIQVPATTGSPGQRPRKVRAESAA